MNDKFSILLEDLSKRLNMQLKPDVNRSCLINFKDKLEIQMELDQSEKDLIIGAKLFELNSGKSREDVLLSALSFNAKPYPRHGIFAYSKKLNCLIMFEKLPVDHFTIDNILSVLTPFVQKALRWKEALENGLTDPGEYSLDDDSQNNPFQA
jgi:hypothetical protein